MVDLPVTHLAPRPADFTATRLGKFRAHVADFFEILGAAVRVSQAVESRHEPDRDDLLTLGIDRPLPKTW